jgi:hypothetical protein
VSDVDRLVDIVDSVHKRFEEEIAKILAKERQYLIRELYKHGINVAKFDESKTSSIHSNEYNMAMLRLQFNLDSTLWLESRKLYNEYKLIRYLENRKCKGNRLVVLSNFRGQ